MNKKEKLIIEYMENHKNEINYPSDIADFYDWDAWKTFQLTEKMKEKGLIV